MNPSLDRLSRVFVGVGHGIVMLHTSDIWPSQIVYSVDGLPCCGVSTTCCVGGVSYRYPLETMCARDVADRSHTAKIKWVLQVTQ